MAGFPQMFLILITLWISLGKVSMLDGPNPHWTITPTPDQADNLIIGPKNEAVFIAINENIYKYSTNNLSLLTSTSTGIPQADTSSQTTYVNKLLFFAKSLLTTCSQSINATLTCTAHKPVDLKAAPLLLINNFNRAFKTDLDEHIRANVGKRDDILIITSRPTMTTTTRGPNGDIDEHDRLPAIGSFGIALKKPLLLMEQKAVLPYKTQLGRYNLLYDYIFTFRHNDYTYFILNDIRVPKNNSSSDITKRTTRIARICDNDTELTSYTEISMVCNNQLDLVARVAHIDDITKEPMLHVAYEVRDDTNSLKKPSAKAFICSYSMKLVEDIFHKVVSDCNNGRQTSYLLAKSNLESVDQLLICKKNPSSDWCTSQTNPYIDGSIDGNRVVQDSFTEIDGMALINFLYPVVQGDESKGVYFVGTESGLLTKLGFDEELFFTIDLSKHQVKQYQIEGEKHLHALTDTSVTGKKRAQYKLKENTTVIAINDAELHSIKLDSCHYYSSCHACLTTRDPLGCTWCGDGCSKRSECPTVDSSTLSCPPIIKDFYPKSGPLSGSTKLSIKGENFGTLKARLEVMVGDQDCLVDRSASTSELVICHVKPVDHPTNASIKINVSDETTYIFSKGSSVSQEQYRFQAVKVFGLESIAGTNSNRVLVHGENLNTGLNQSVILGDLSCDNIKPELNQIFCTVRKPIDQSILKKSHPLKVLIDGHEQFISPDPPMSTNFLFKFGPDPDNEVENSIEAFEPERNIGFTFWIVVALTLVTILLICFKKSRKLICMKIPPFKSNYLDNHQDIDTKVSFRNPHSNKFINSNPNVRPSESLNGLVKLNGSILSSDYFGKPEKLDQDRPLMQSCLDDEMMMVLAQEKILIDRNRLTLGHVLGSGQFGRVYKGFLKIEHTGEHMNVAVKTLHNRCAWDDSIDSGAFLEEGLMMKDFKHDNVLALIGVTFDSSGAPMVITPFMLYGDLRSYVSDEASSPTVKELIEFGVQVAKGMAYLSNLKFVHRDLAARNCMLDENLVVKVADFGLSRDIYERDYYSSDNKKAKLPVKWMAIESLEKSVYSSKTDVWSYGVLLWELMTRGVVPYPDVDNFDLFSYLKEGRRMMRPRYCPKILYSIMLTCWDESPANRPSFDELVEQVSDVITQLQEAKDGVQDRGQQKVSRDETYCDVISQ